MFAPKVRKMGDSLGIGLSREAIATLKVKMLKFSYFRGAYDRSAHVTGYYKITC